MQAKEARRLTQLEKENARFKMLLAVAEFEKAMPKDFAKRNFRARNGGAGLSRFCKIASGLLNGLSDGWRGSTAAPSAIAANLSTSR